jgi:hypothetical protein
MAEDRVPTGPVKRQVAEARKKIKERRSMKH